MAQNFVYDGEVQNADGDMASSTHFNSQSLTDRPLGTSIFKESGTCHIYSKQKLGSQKTATARQQP